VGINSGITVSVCPRDDSDVLLCAAKSHDTWSKRRFCRILTLAKLRNCCAPIVPRRFGWLRFAEIRVVRWFNGPSFTWTSGCIVSARNHKPGPIEERQCCRHSRTLSFVQSPEPQQLRQAQRYTVTSISVCTALRPLLMIRI
jgi:hypothetical protein